LPRNDKIRISHSSGNRTTNRTYSDKYQQAYSSWTTRWISARG